MTIPLVISALLNRPDPAVLEAETAARGGRADADGAPFGCGTNFAEEVPMDIAMTACLRCTAAEPWSRETETKFE